MLNINSNLKLTHRISSDSKAGRMACKIGLLVAIISVGMTSMAQQKTITIYVLDGKSGKPISGEHLLVTEGDSLEEVRQQKNHYDLRTDAQGKATMPVASNVNSQIQVWVDFHVLCQKTPNAGSFSVNEIMERGMSTPNNCGSVSVESGPGKFFVFARKPTFWEKMRR